MSCRPFGRKLAVAIVREVAVAMWQVYGHIYGREKDKKNQLWWGHKQQQEQQQGLAWLFNPHHIGIHTQRHHQIGAGLKLMQY